MQVGFAKTIITPSLERPVFLAGFGHNRRAESVHDDLFARALAISAEQTTLVLCSVDLIGLFAPEIDKIRETLKVSETFRVLNPEIVIAATHTHHGPDTAGLWGPDDKTRGVDEAYMTELRQKVAETILAALGKLQPVSGVKSGSVFVRGIVKNARNPEILDEELTVLQFLDGVGNPLASLFNFPCHPEVLWEHNPHITADYPGFLCAEAEKQTNAPCIFFSGALGGMMTPDVKEHSFAEAKFMGKKLADEGLKAIQNAELTVNGLPSMVSIQKREFAAKLTNPLYKLAFWRKLLPDTRDKKGNIVSEVNLIKIGDAWFATVPGELLPKLGLEIKALLTEKGARVAGVLGLANGWFGYILPAEDFKYPWNPFNPGAHYEETNSIGKEIGPKVMEGIDKLL
jgi:hypothetical protein